MKIFKKIISLFMFAAAALATACSDSVSEGVAVEAGSANKVSVEGDVAVSFSINFPTTRGAVTTAETFDSFKIYLYYPDIEDAEVAEYTMFVDANGVWSLYGEDTIYIPSGTTTIIYAYEGGDGVTLNAEDGVVNYTMPEDVSKQSSIIMAVPIVIVADGESESIELELTFDYALAAVGFKSIGDYTLTKVEMSNFVSSAAIAFSEDMSASSYTYGEVDTEVYTSYAVEDTDSSNYFMIPAQSMDGVTITAYLSYYDEDGVEKDTTTRTITLSENSELANTGMVYTYEINTMDYDAEPETLTTTLSSTALGSILTGDVIETNVTATPEATIYWTSSNSALATVDSDGVITTVAGGGTVTITGTTLNGASISFTATVYAKFLGYEATPSSLALTVGGSAEYVIFNKIFGPYTNSSYLEGISNETRSYYSKNSSSLSTFTVARDSYNDTSITLSITPSKYYATSDDDACQVNYYAKGNISGETCEKEYCYITVTGSGTTTTTTTSKYASYSVGDYLNSSGNVTTSASSAVAVVFYVDVDNEFGLAASVSSASRRWAPSAYYNTTTSATSSTDGLSNTNKIIDVIGYSPTNIYNAASYAYSLGTISAIYDSSAGKGQFYMPSRNELSLFMQAILNQSGVYTLSSTNFSAVSGYTYKSGTFYKAYVAVNSSFASTGYLWSSTESGSSTAYNLCSDGSGYSSGAGKYSNSYTVVPIIKF